MKKVWWDTSRQLGFSSVEGMLAAVLFALLVSSIIGAIIYGRASQVDAGHHARATQLASEGIEAVRNIRDANYSTLNNGVYGLVKSGGVWALSGSSDAVGAYTRSVTISGQSDNRKTITSTVSWPTGSVSSKSTLETKITNWRTEIIPPRSWTKATYTGGVDISGTADGTKVATQGDFAYIVRSGGAPDFIVLDISNRDAPVVVSAIDIAGSPTNIAVQGNYAYVTNTLNNAELQTVSIANPASPAVIASDDIVGNADATGVYISGGYGYVTRLANFTLSEFAIVSLANPASPTAAGGYGNNINMREVYISGNYAYIVTDSDTQEILVVDVTIPLFPQFVRAINLPGTTNATSIAGKGDAAFVGQGTALRAINLANQAVPTVASSYTSSGTIYDVAVHSSDPSYIFLGTNRSNAELQVVDVTALSSMKLAKSVDVPGVSSILYGVAYNATRDIVVGADNSNTREGVVFGPN